MKLKKHLFLYFIWWIHSSIGFAQVLDSLYVTKEVEIKPRQADSFEAGRFVYAPDTSLSKSLQGNSLANLIYYDNTIYSKSYGNGSLSSISLRGTSAQHTALNWNGFSIQSTMSGMTDLNLVTLQDGLEMQIKSGAQGAIYGSGAVGGSINLNSKINFDSHLSRKIRLNTNTNTSLGLAHYFEKGNSNNYISHTINTFYSQNPIKYEVAYASKANAPYGFFDGQLTHSKKYNQNHIWQQNIWIRYNNRKVVPPEYSNNGNQKMQDASIRLGSIYQTKFKQLNVNFRNGLFYDNLTYVDTVSNINSKNATFSSQNEIETKYKLGARWTILNSVQANIFSAFTNNYNQIPVILRFASINGISYSSQNIKLSFANRTEKDNLFQLRIIPSLGLNIRVNQNWYIQSGISKSYRTPTLNDLYWVNLGNKNLQPENGWNIDGAISFSIKNKLSITYTPYLSQINNWILWNPNDYGIFVPQNLKTVSSYGNEIKAIYDQTFKKLSIKHSIDFAYRSATSVASIFPNDSTLGKQLIYTPQYTAGYKISATFNKLQFSWIYQYAGYRYTSTDHSSWLNPYSLHHLILAYQSEVFKKEYSVNVLINNILNTKYELVKNYPMLGTNASLVLKINL